MKFKKLKKILSFGLKVYLSAYIGASAYIPYDFFKYNLPRLERGDTLQILETRRYTTKINGAEKNFTITGERHSYNKKEHELAKKLINEHQYFASECGDGVADSAPFCKILYEHIVYIPNIITGPLYRTGSGRHYSSITSIVREGGHGNVYTLETISNGRFSCLSILEKTRFLTEQYLSLLIAPYYYYDGKNEQPYNQLVIEKKWFFNSFCRKRDKIMASNLAGLLKEDGVDYLLVNVGRAHFDGLIKDLSEQIEMKQIQ